MTETDYPNIFYVADSTSKKAQKRFIKINLSILLLLVLSTLSTFYYDTPEYIYFITSCLLILSTLMTVLVFFLRPEKVWYDGRAIAESAKSLTWKFMMGITPFPYNLSSKQAEEKLIKNLKRIIGQKKEFYKLIGENFSEGEQITTKMIEYRQKDISEKIQIYSKERLEEQRKWYYSKSGKNRRNKNIAFLCLIVFQLLAFLSLILDINESVYFSATPLLATLATSTIALLQLKRFQELTESYGITATELSFIKSKIKHVKTKDDFQDFVDDAETAISREHTLWLARRDSVDLFH